jgi:hypothetical protein
MIDDANVQKIIYRKDLSGKEKMLLIYILSCEPKPEKETDDMGITTIKQGMAYIGPKQVAEDLGKGFHPSSFKASVKGLRKRGFLDQKGDKGGHANRYRVMFPQKKAMKKN